MIDILVLRVVLNREIVKDISSDFVFIDITSWIMWLLLKSFFTSWRVTVDATSYPYLSYRYCEVRKMIGSLNLDDSSYSSSSDLKHLLYTWRYINSHVLKCMIVYQNYLSIMEDDNFWNQTHCGSHSTSIFWSLVTDHKWYALISKRHDSSDHQ